MERLDRLEQCMQQQEAMLASTASDAQQSAAASEQAIVSLTALVQQLSTAIAQLITPVSLAPAASSPPPVIAVSPGPGLEPHVGTPERYRGDPEGCNPFITNCSILFALQPHTFATERAKVAFTINHLTERARLWGTAEWDRQSPVCASFQLFSTELRKVFGMPSSGPDIAGGLLGLQQGTRTVANYAIEFRTRALHSQWNPAAQTDAFLRGLADYIKDELVSFELPSSLDGLIELVTRLDSRIQARRRERRQGPSERRLTHRSHLFPGPTSSSAITPVGSSEPMEVGRTSLSPEERTRRRQGNLCLYCGGSGHFVSRCPVKAEAHQ